VLDVELACFPRADAALSDKRNVAVLLDMTFPNPLTEILSLNGKSPQVRFERVINVGVMLHGCADPFAKRVNFMCKLG